jgi:hypothetical protein
MPNRSWFYASNGQQQGPYPDAQLRELIARGTVTADTLVWSEGMAGWQRVGEIPGLFGSASGPPAIPRSGVPQAGAGGYGGGPLSIDFEILEFTWRSLVLFVGLIFVIPAPWALVWYLKWLVPCVSVPGRPNLSFEGNAMTIATWFFGFVVLAILVGLTGVKLLSNLLFLVEIALYWLFAKWFVANLSSNGQPLGLRFTGSPWGFIGYSLLAAIAIVTIVGWAWVYVAQLRWMCRHIEGARREIVFNATGLEFLWRSIVTALACVFIIPIPWMYRWFAGWVASQTVLVESGTQADA